MGELAAAARYHDAVERQAITDAMRWERQMLAEREELLDARARVERKEREALAAGPPPAIAAGPSSAPASSAPVRIALLPASAIRRCAPPPSFMATMREELPIVQIRDVKPIIQEYDGSSVVNVRQYLDRADQFFRSVQGSDVWRSMALRSCLTGAAADFVAPRGAMSYTEFRTALVNELSRDWATTEIINCSVGSGPGVPSRCITMPLICRPLLHWHPFPEVINCIIAGLGLARDDANLLLATATDGTVHSLKAALNRHERRLMEGINMRLSRAIRDPGVRATGPAVAARGSAPGPSQGHPDQP